MSTAVQMPRVKRLPQIDNLKSVMVAWIIVGHAFLGYSAVGGWPYDEVNEVTLGSRSELTLAILVGPSALFVVGTFFFLAGMFAPSAVARKGPGRFAGDRVLRLGVPWLGFMLLVWPVFMWLAYRAAGHRVSYWWAFTHRQPLLDSGPLWFAEILLYFSLAYAAWWWIAAKTGRQPGPANAPLSGGQLVAVAGGVALASFAVRLWFPAKSTQVLDLHLWEWPQSLAMFGLGVAAAGRGWAAEVPDRLYRRCGFTVAATLATVPMIAFGVGVSNVAQGAAPFVGGWHWQAMVLASVEASLVVAGSVWVLGTAQRRLLWSGRLSAACSRAAFAAFVLQAPVLLTVAIAARPLALTAEAKAVLVGGVAVLVSFWLGWLIIERVRPGRP
jgi:hypothetical protein